MYIVRFRNHKRHSIWNTKREALKQIETLNNCGYKDCYYEYLDASMNYENGHYFV
ncbi:hypothetical protein LCGC14_1735800 [marine sediment metagenome]|uniref:Uncharacterized protein n=1 Tax=marine sediment metagenome TaxID=412755 RepID=A0A0F9K7W6_9ZZZZ